MRVDRLVEAARAAFDEAPEDRPDIVVGAAEIDAERIERVGRADDDAAEHRRQAGRRPDAERQRRRLVLRLALVPESP